MYKGCQLLIGSLTVSGEGGQMVIGSPNLAYHNASRETDPPQIVPEVPEISPVNF